MYKSLLIGSRYGFNVCMLFSQQNILQEMSEELEEGATYSGKIVEIRFVPRITTGRFGVWWYWLGGGGVKPMGLRFRNPVCCQYWRSA